MDLKVIARIAKSRWLILAIVGIMAVVVVSNLLEYQDDNKLTNEASATVTFNEDPATLDRASFEEFLADQHVLAQDVNSDVLGDTPGSFLPWQLAEIDLTADQNQITFIGRGYTQEEATELVQMMQDRYLAISSVGAGYEELGLELTDLTSEIAELEVKVAQYEIPTQLTPEQVAIETQRASLTSAIASFISQYGQLRTELVTPVERTTSQIQADIAAVQEAMLSAQNELAALPPAPAASALLSEQAIIDRLQLENLRVRYQTVYAERARLEGLATGTPVISQAVTANSGSPFINETFAFVAAVVLTLFALVAIERTRGVIWVVNDVDGAVPGLTELPPRGLDTFKRPTASPWYVTVPGGHRKAAVQMIRSQLDGYQNVAVAFQGVGAYDYDTIELSADVALSAAVSGRSVLLIDATFSGDNQLVEYSNPNSPDLTTLLMNSSSDPEAAMAEFKELLLGQADDYSNLRVIRSQDDLIDPGDAMASQRFEMLLDVARHSFDLVIVAGAGFGNPTSYILAQRVDHSILVGSIGHTIDRDVDAVERDFRTRRATLLGIVLVRRRRSKLGRWIGPKVRNAIWSMVDRFRPTGNKIKDSFRSEEAEAERPGISGFSGRLTEINSVDRDRYLYEGDEADA